MRDKELAAYLAEAIRRAIAWEHLPGCQCRLKLRNECREKILEEAFRLYCKERPHAHGDIF